MKRNKCGEMSDLYGFESYPQAVTKTKFYPIITKRYRSENKKIPGK